MFNRVSNIKRDSTKNIPQNVLYTVEKTLLKYEIIQSGCYSDDSMSKNAMDSNNTKYIAPRVWDGYFSKFKKCIYQNRRQLLYCLVGPDNVSANVKNILKLSNYIRVIRNTRSLWCSSENNYREWENHVQLSIYIFIGLNGKKFSSI